GAITEGASEPASSRQGITTETSSGGVSGGRSAVSGAMVPVIFVAFRLGVPVPVARPNSGPGHVRGSGGAYLLVALPYRASMSAFTIISTSSSRLVRASQPSTRFAFEGAATTSSIYAG